MRSATKLRSLVDQLGAHCNELTAAPYFAAQVHMADHIYRTIHEINQEVEHFIKSANRQVVAPRPRSAKEAPPKTISGLPVLHLDEHEHEKHHPELSGQPFKTMTIAEAGRALLKERGVLHGKEIERLLVQGGYPTKSTHFQSIMIVAFQRAGIFENIGRNRWRLKSATSNSNGRAEVGQAERKN